MTKRIRESAIDGVCEERFCDPEALARATSKLSQVDDIRAMADAFKALGNPARLKVLEALDGEELCVCDLSEILGLSMSGTSQQLRELRRLGAIEYRVSGKFAYYRLADGFWLDLIRTVLNHVSSDRKPTVEGVKQAV